MMTLSANNEPYSLMNLNLSSSQSGDFIKIGYTRSPDARVMKMRTDCPMPIALLHSEPGTFKDERVLHRQFAAHRTQGEFRATPELLEYIEHRKRP